MYTLLLNNLNPIINTAERDPVLLELLINARKQIVLRIYELATKN